MKLYPWIFAVALCVALLSTPRASADEEKSGNDFGEDTHNLFEVSYGPQFMSGKRAYYKYTHELLNQKDDVGKALFLSWRPLFLIRDHEDFHAEIEMSFYSFEAKTHTSLSAGDDVTVTDSGLAFLANVRMTFSLPYEPSRLHVIAHAGMGPSLGERVTLESATGTYETSDESRAVVLLVGPGIEIEPIPHLVIDFRAVMGLSDLDDGMVTGGLGYAF